MWVHASYHIPMPLTFCFTSPSGRSQIYQSVATACRIQSKNQLVVVIIECSRRCAASLLPHTRLILSATDYTSLLDLLPPASAQLAEVKHELALLKPHLEKAQKQETAEMLDKLKGLGNSVLGRHGCLDVRAKTELQHR